MNNEREVRVKVSVAPRISDDSWLHRSDPTFEAFKKGYDYASTQTRAIGPLAKLTPEEAYDVWAAVQRGVEYHEPEFRIRSA